LNLLFFDEEFVVPQEKYTACDHFNYIEFNKLHYPSKFKELEHTFITKID